LNSGHAYRVSLSDFRYAKGGKLQAFKKNCLAATAATSLHSRITLAARQMPELHFEFRITQSARSYKHNVGSNPASPNQRGNRLMERHQFTDVYQVQRTLKAVLEAQPFREKGSMIEKIMQTELLVSPY